MDSVLSRGERGKYKIFRDKVYFRLKRTCSVKSESQTLADATRGLDKNRTTTWPVRGMKDLRQRAREPRRTHYTRQFEFANRIPQTDSDESWTIVFHDIYLSIYIHVQRRAGENEAAEQNAIIPIVIGCPILPRSFLNIQKGEGYHIYSTTINVQYKWLTL